MILSLLSLQFINLIYNVCFQGNLVEKHPSIEIRNKLIIWPLNTYAVIKNFGTTYLNFRRVI